MPALLEVPCRPDQQGNQVQYDNKEKRIKNAKRYIWRQYGHGTLLLMMRDRHNFARNHQADIIRLDDGADDGAGGRMACSLANRSLTRAVTSPICAAIQSPAGMRRVGHVPAAVLSMACTAAPLGSIYRGKPAARAFRLSQMSDLLQMEESEPSADGSLFASFPDMDHLACAS
jgi:hypothetical protein